MKKRTPLPSSDKYKNVEGILDIVRNGLCHRCGGCIGVCPSNTLTLDDNCFPIQIDSCAHCGLCTEICSGADINYPAIGNCFFGDKYQYQSPLGIVHSAFIGHANDDEIRWKGASGGAVTQLLAYLLESNKIQGALVAGPHPEAPFLGLGFIARNWEDILVSAQSRYTTTPMLTALKDISKEKGPFAVVALPCQIHTLRKLQAKSKKWRKKISVVIGLYCHYRLPHEATIETASIVAPQGATLAAIKYRQKDTKGWPHNTVEMTFTDGATWRSPYGPAQTVSLLAHCYPRGRCLLCVDALSEFADIVVGDPWIRSKNGDWKYSVPGGWSGIVVRTEIGALLLEESSKASALTLQAIPADEVIEGQRVMIREKVESAPVRMAFLKCFGRKTPNYHIDFPSVTAKIFISELKFFLLRVISIWRPVRKMFVRLGFSATGRKFMARRRQWNKKRAVARMASKQ